MKALRRLIHEGERVYFGVNAERRRAVGVDLSKTELVSEDDFNTSDPDEDGGSVLDGWKKRYGD